MLRWREAIGSYSRKDEEKGMSLFCLNYTQERDMLTLYEIMIGLDQPGRYRSSLAERFPGRQSRCDRKVHS
jgi:hypothetical protein